MASSSDTYVLVGERRKAGVAEEICPQEADSPGLRQRNSQSCTPQFNRTQNVQQSGASPTLKDLVEGRVEVGLDSGYAGSLKGPSLVKKKLDYDPYGNPNGSYLDGMGNSSANSDLVGSPATPSLWETLSSPVLDLGKRIQGRQSFLDEGRRHKKVQHHHMLAGIVLIVVMSSLGFALLLTYNHFNNLKSGNLNGKMKSIKYGSEKRMASLKHQGRVLSRELRDETGVNLGGKRASLQFAFDSQVPREEVEESLLGGEPEARPDAVLGLVQVEEARPLRQSQSQVLGQVGFLELSTRLDSMARLLQANLNLPNNDNTMADTRFRDATNDGNETKKEEIDSAAAAAAVEDGAIKDDIQTSNVVDGETENSRDNEIRRGGEGDSEESSGSVPAKDQSAGLDTPDGSQFRLVGVTQKKRSAQTGGQTFRID